MLMSQKERQLYYQNLLDKAESQLDGVELELATLIVKQAKVEYYEANFRSAIYDLLKEINDKDFLHPLVQLVKKWLGAEIGDLFQYIVKHQTEYPYSEGYHRRPFRTNNLKWHFSGLITKLVAILKLDCQSFNILDYLTSKSDLYYSVISDIIAYELDRQNPQVFEGLKEIIYGENNTALLNRFMIYGILRSHQQAGYEMLGELLLAARLQEGLRQSIVESMDEGTLAANLYLLNIIIEHDLIRYSSVIRALDVWTGLSMEAANKRVAQKCIDLAYQYLTDQAAREQGIYSSDVDQIYLSLWATAVFEEEDVADKIYTLMDQGALYQKIVAQSFLSQSQHDDLKFEIAQKYLTETDQEIQYYLLLNYGYQCSFGTDYSTQPYKPKITFKKVPALEDKHERERQFYLFKEMLSSLPKKELTFTSKVFNEAVLTISTDSVAHKLLYLIAYDMDPNWIQQLLAFKDKVSSDIRHHLLMFFMNDLTDPIQRDYLFECLADKSMHVRESALAKMSAIRLSNAEVEKIETILKLKTGALRQKAIQILLLLESEALETSLDRLIHSKQELQRLGAIEILTELKDNPERQLVYHSLRAKIADIAHPTEKEKILIQKLANSQEKGLANGFGLYQPNQKASVPMKNLAPLHLRDVFTLTTEEVVGFLKGLSALIHEHRNYEYVVEYSGGEKESVLLGTRLGWVTREDGDFKQIDRYPLADIWKNYLHENGLTTEQIIQVHYLLYEDDLYRFYDQQLSRWEQDYYPTLDEGQKEFLDKIFPMDQLGQVQNLFKELDYSQYVYDLIRSFFNDLEQAEAFRAMSRILYTMTQVGQAAKAEVKLINLLVQPWLGWCNQFVQDDEDFTTYFPALYHLYNDLHYRNRVPSIEDFARAMENGIFEEEELYRELLSRENSRQHYRELTDPKGEFLKRYPFMVPIKERVLETILDIELNRGDMPTEVTALALYIRQFEGMDYFVKILLGTDKESYTRGYIYSYDGQASKKETFSHLLRGCYPLEGEDEVLLGELLKGKKVAEKRLLEAAMYAPQWLDIVAKYLQWDGLRSAAWYFHAHINESFSAEKETIIGHYSPIKPEDFNDGAFDIAWFKEAYQQIGEKRFHILYDCAKYISGGANHRRSQLFADATLGKMNLAHTKQSVIDKRNKDQLLCYSLIPIDVTDERDVLTRYEFLQAFLKESKSFGAQRRVSEAKVVAIALENLARNAGYQDVIRLQWEMEAKKIVEIQPYLEPKQIDDVHVSLIIDEDGKTDLFVQKNGKALKSLPAKYNKHEYVLELKAIKADLTSQYKRAREELERSMERQTSFTLGELNKMMMNPVIAPLVGGLVLKAGEHLGYLRDGKLVGVTGEYTIDDHDEVLIAHPVHLYESGHWSGFQRDLFNRQLKQPFKQVFRELYIPNQDELGAGTVSMRYAGHQVQPRKSVALLKGRNWTVSYEEGLQKVFYRENVIAKIYALADWFSPSDIESPTLETVEFFDRHTYKSIPLKDVPKIVFSETMRDVDLVVSVAHVGGVDPEASLTTIEMRRAIVEESIRLLGLDNVRVEGNFALIEGSLGEYSVHLGSANAYQQASGALFIIPVHSQHRGRIFLPFIDEDPRTAETLSKILLLAQDKKIKDPAILGQIKR
jgi:hypothetical protein